MGMSASQARYLGLIARQNDLEYQGQQINQERTILSQQVTDLYNTLQTLNVPTPPSTSDFTTVTYSGSLGATTFTMGSVVPSGSTYNINLEYTKKGNSTYSKGKAEVKDTPATIKVSEVDKSKTAAYTEMVASTDGQVPAGTYPENGKPVLHKINSASDLAKDEYKNCDVFVRQSDGSFFKRDRAQLTEEDYKQGVFVRIEAATTTDEVTGETTSNVTPGIDYYFTGQEPKTFVPSINYNEISKYYVDKGGKLEHATVNDFHYNDTTKKYEFESNVSYYILDEANGEDKINPDFEIGIGKSLNGSPLMTWDTAKARMTEEEQKSALEALRNGFPEYAKTSDQDLLNMFYISFTQEGSLQVPHFTFRTEVDGAMPQGSNTQWATFYDITESGTYTETEKFENCQLTFDTSGRITAISLPIVDKNTGEIVYQTVKVEAKQTYDEAAYQDAFNKYEYAKFEYDKEQQEINAKTEVIQQEDKKLELKLQRLDNERTQIKTEIDAVKQVIKDNIEGSYKTFSG